MDDARFDALTRFLARSASRRTTLRVVAAALFGLGLSTRARTTSAAPDGCCKCVGKSTQCMDTANKRDCRTYCGVNDDEKIVFSELHTCTKGGQGTSLQCRNKKKSDSSSVDEPDELCDAETCTETAALPTSPATAAAQDLASRIDDGWALQQATACLDGDACRAGGLFGAVPGDEVERLAARVIDGYRQKTARRTVTPEVPSDVVEHRFFRFSQPSDAEEFTANIRGLVPPDATDRSGELQIDVLSFVFGLSGPTADIPDPAAETLIAGAQSGNIAIYSSIVTTSGSAVPGYIDQEYADLINSFARSPINLDLELLSVSAVSLFGSPVRPEVDLAVSVLDGQSLPRDGESAEQTDFRLLTDAATIHALRSSFVLDSVLGPANIVHEVREFLDPEAAQDFVALSLNRVTDYFGAALFTFVVTEFDALGDQGTGFIYTLNQPNGGFVGGVTGYARLGPLVGVTNVNVRTDAPPSVEILNAVQDGRGFAFPGVSILDRQLQVWRGTESNPELDIGMDEAFRALFPVGP